MALIKGHSAEHQTAQAVVLDLGDIRSQAEEILNQARAEADRLIAEANTQAQTIQEEAKTNGYRQGFDQGVAEGQQKGQQEGQTQALQASQEMFTQIQEAWIHAAGQWDKMRHEMISEAQQSLLKLSLLIAEKVVHRVQQVDHTIIEAQVQAAIDYVVRPCDVRVHICPDDRPHMEKVLPQLLKQLDDSQHVHLVDDPQIARGGCVVDYGKGKIDATIDSQMQQVVESILPQTLNALPSEDSDQTDKTTEHTQTSESPQPPEESP